jgi:hypothetical protein
MYILNPLYFLTILFAEIYILKTKINISKSVFTHLLCKYTFAIETHLFSLKRQI